MTRGPLIGAALIVTSILFGGCASDARPADSISSALGIADDNHVQSLDLDRSVKGDWTRLIVLCTDTAENRREVEQLLGFAWVDAPSHSDNVAQTTIFATDDSVESQSVVHWGDGRVYLCTSRFFGSPPPGVWSLDRDDSELSFVYETWEDDTDPLYGGPPDPVWYLVAESRDRD